MVFDQGQGGKGIRITDIQAHDEHKLFVAIAVGLAHGEVMVGQMNSSAANLMKERRKVVRRSKKDEDRDCSAMIMVSSLLSLQLVDGMMGKKRRH